MDIVKKAFPKRFEVHWINLDSTISAEAKKTRPCVIISPNSMNEGLQTIIIAPLTSAHKNWPFRIGVLHKKKKGQIMLDQMRTVSKKRLHKRDGTVSPKAKNAIVDVEEVSLYFRKTWTGLQGRLDGFISGYFSH